MAFTKGQQKTGGRKKGTPNKATDGLRQKFLDFAESRYEDALLAFDQITEPEKKVKAYIDICSYALPKLQAVQLDATVNNQSSVEDDLRKLAEEEV